MSGETAIFGSPRSPRPGPSIATGRWDAPEQAFAAFLEMMVTARHPYAGRLTAVCACRRAGAEHVTSSAPVSLASGSLMTRPDPH
jgi:hypothetical protein